MFCPECGTQIDDSLSIFCPECGTRIIEADIESNDTCKSQVRTHFGVILTNIKLLSEKLGVEKKNIHNLINKFIEKKRNYGVFYRLADVCEYNLPKKSFFSFNNSISLKADSPIESYLEVLDDCYNRNQKDAPCGIQYLFIIGGNDIIPMPCTKHYTNDCSDKNIDSDIIYAYPYINNIIDKLESQEILQYEQRFLVGRLPIGEDNTINDFSDYLQRSIDNSHGITIGGAYGQCDPNWMNVSATVTKGTLENHFRNLDGQLPKECYFQRLILSPNITIDNIANVLHTNASLYYFNLHGSNALKARGYFGVPLRRREALPVILPEHIQMAKQTNIIVCEACYGARFIGLDKQHSMMLSALYTNSLLFLGSSRIAWGNVDPKNIIGYKPVTPMLADVMAQIFIAAMFNGYTAGEALFIARSTVLELDPNGSPLSMATIVEFNLFGDPSLFINASGIEMNNLMPIAPQKCKRDAFKYGSTSELIDLNSINSSASILQQVRNAVDNNIQSIHNTIGQYLYAEYGIDPRPANSIFKVKYKNGTTELKFNYEITTQSDLTITYSVFTNENGTIKNVITTK